MTEIRKLSMQPTNVTFSDLLDHHTEFHIPLYQRDYTWTEEQVGDFIDDALMALDGKSTRFFGTILVSDTSPDQVAAPDRNIRYVIDGQQRLTTLLICLVALRHLALELSELHPAARDFAERIYLRLSVETDEQDKRLARLYANRENNDFLAALLDRETEGRSAVDAKFSALPSKTVQRSCVRLKGSYVHAYRTLRDAIVVRTTGVPVPSDSAEATLISLLTTAGEAADGANKILEIFNYLLRNSLLVKIHITEWLEAFDLFDGLNNRGMELAKRDVLKNVLLSRASKENQEAGLRELEKSWAEFERLLPESAFAKFLRHFLLLENESVSLSGATRMYIEKTKSIPAKEALLQLRRAAEHYQVIIEPSTGVDLNKETSNRLENLVALSAERVRPILLACLLQKVKAKGLNDLLATIETLYFRRSTICQQDNKALEGTVQKIASEIFKSGDAAIPQAIAALKAESPDDVVFQKMFESKSGMPAAAARYMLHKLENHGVSNGGLLVHGGTLEHILPQEPSQFWGLDKNDPETRELIGRIGNLTLLRQTENSKACNKPFADKRSIYNSDDESLKINALVVNKSKWGRAEIEARQRELAQQALKVWSV